MVAITRITKITFCPKFTRSLFQEGKNGTIRDLYIRKPLGSIANIKGWVKNLRKSKAVAFINVNDGTCLGSIQVVIPRALFSDKITIGSSVCTSGKVGTDHRGNIEILAERINVTGLCNIADGFPFTPGRNYDFDHFRKFLHHRPTLPFFSALLRIRNTATLAVHKYFNDDNFIGIHTPILTGNDCEGAGETFVVEPSKDVQKCVKTEGTNPKEDFFNKKAFLTVSGQFHLEALARSFSKVYTFNPTFRAENSKSRLHLSEFYMVEAEEAFIPSLSNVLSTAEKLVKNVISNLISACDEDINFILRNSDTDSKNHLEMLNYILEKPFTVMNYLEAKETLSRHKVSVQYAKESGFTKEEELFLVRQNENVPIFVINWPENLKPFYAKACDEKADQVQAVDLLVPVVGELCGGSVREDDYEILHEKLKKLDALETLAWYLELRKFGNVTSGGFGMGFERFLQFVLNVQNIKDTIPFPRWPHNLQL